MKSVLLADDQEIVTEGIESVLAKGDKFRVISKVNHPNDILDSYHTLKPDFLVTELLFESSFAEDAISKIMLSDPYARVIVLTNLRDDSYFEKCKNMNVKGYLTKASFNSLTDAMSSVLKGRVYYDPAFEKKEVNTDLRNTLTDQEIKIFTLMSRNVNIKDIGIKMGLSSKTVSNVRTKLKTKFNLTSQHELVELAKSYKL